MRGNLFLGGFVCSASTHATLHPFIGLREVGLAGGIVAALEVSFTPLGEVQDRHSIVVGGIDLDCSFQVLLSIRDEVCVRGYELLADRFGLLDIALAVILQASGCQDVCGVFVGLGPVNVANGVVGFGI